MSLQVAPEIEAKVREVAAARGVSTDMVLDEALQLLQKRRPAPVVPEGGDSSREMAWVARPDLTFVNQWVALDGDKVLAHGPDAKGVVAEARAKGLTAPFLHFVREPFPDPLFIGWLGTERL